MGAKTTELMRPCKIQTSDMAETATGKIDEMATNDMKMTCTILNTIGLFRGLITVFDAILTSRQQREKLHGLYENLLPSNFCKTAVLKK